MKVSNLDAACAKLEYELGRIGKAKETENSLTKVLGVLEEQGVYALFLYLHARENREFSRALMKFLCSEDVRLVRQQKQGDSEPFEALQELAKNLDDLLFARDVLYQAVVYGRYHAKAAQGHNAGDPGSGGQRTKPGERNRSRRPKKLPRRGGEGRKAEADK